jgi:hypothetical protein
MVVKMALDLEIKKPLVVDISPFYRQKFEGHM